MSGRPKKEKQKAPGWGGARKGAGRPAKPPKAKASLQVAFRLTEAEAAQILALAREGETLHSACKRLALEASNRTKATAT
jgi:hypothetical protein